MSPAMGVDLEVMFAATIGAAEAFALPARLRSSPAVVAACRLLDEPGEPSIEPQVWIWHWPELPAPASILAAWTKGHLPMLGPPGFLYVGPNQISLRPPAKLAGFASDYEGCREPIRRVCRAVAGELGADRVLYLPDSGDWPSEVGDLANARFDDAVARLTAWGPPAASIAELEWSRALRLGYHYAEGALRRPDGTAVPHAEIWPGYNRISSGGIERYHDGTLVPPEELARPHLHGGFAYYIDDFRDLTRAD